MSTTDQLSPEQVAKLAGEDLGPLSRNIIIAFTVMAFVSVCLRLYTRLRYKAVGWEDYTIGIAMLFAIATGVCQVLQISEGNGKHERFVPYPEKVQLGLKYLFWSIIAYNISLVLIKVSIILQYQRIFTLGNMRWPLNIAMAICVVWGIITFVTSIFTCVPVTAYWRVLEKANARCIKDEILWFPNAGVNIFTDLMIALLPVKSIWGLQIPNRQKIALVGILTIGWFVCLVSILRLHALIILSHHPKDRTYYSATAAYWSSIEMNLGIVCACLPALKPLIVRIIPGFSTRGSSRGYEVGLSGRQTQDYGLGSRATRRNTRIAAVELTTTQSMKAKAFSSRADQDDLGKSIYISQQVEHHFEKTSRSGSDMDVDIDSESQKDLVTNTSFPSPRARQ